MRTVEIELIPCKACGAKDAQVIVDCMGGFRPWSIYCNSCGRNDAEFYGRSKFKAVMAWMDGNK